MALARPRPTPRSAPDPNGGYAAWSDVGLLHDRRDPAESFAIFYRRHVGGVIRFAASRGLDADAAADVVSDTFLGALKLRYRYREEKESARLWLLAIAARRIADSRRQRASERRRLQRLQTEAIVLTQEDREGYRRLLDEEGPGLDALSDLPLIQQAAIRARVVEQHEYEEIAEALGLSQPAVRQQVSRGLSRLRNRLKDDKS